MDYFVNNARRNFFGPVLDLDVEDAKDLFEASLWASLVLLQALAPLLIEAKGTIVNIASICGYLDIPRMGKSSFVTFALHIANGSRLL